MFLEVIQKPPFSDIIFQKVKTLLTQLGFSGSRADMWDRIMVLIMIIIVAYLCYLLFSKLLIRIVHYIVTHTKTKWDLFLYNRKFFERLFEFIPPLMVLILLPLAFTSDYQKLLNILEIVINIYLTIIAARIAISILCAGFDYYLERHELTSSPYQGVVDMGRMIIQIVMVLVIVGLIMNMKLKEVITGLSAFAAVLILIFKDTLLGFIAGIQLAHNNMLKIGDWITVPNSNANGNILEINILTVKVQNFDNTFVYVPCYSLLTGSFQNWSGMLEAGVRRVNKSILLDVSTVKQTDDALLDKLYADPHIKSFIGDEGYEKFLAFRTDNDPLLRTNLGLFRAWLILYMEHDPDITNQPYLIVREVESTGAGIPIELLFFIKTTVWADYERIQSIMFEQIMMCVPAFGLAQFQYNVWPHTDANNPMKPIPPKPEEKKPDSFLGII